MSASSKYASSEGEDAPVAATVPKSKPVTTHPTKQSKPKDGKEDEFYSSGEKQPGENESNKLSVKKKGRSSIYRKATREHRIAIKNLQHSVLELQKEVDTLKRALHAQNNNSNS